MPKSAAEHKKLKMLGDNVRRERVRAGLTQEALAEKTDLHPRSLQKIEAGSIAILVPTLARLQAALRCEWNELLGPGVRPPAFASTSPAKIGKAARGK